MVLFVDDPFAVGRPNSAVLPVIRLRQLDWPSPCSAHFPEIGPTRDVGGENNLLPVRRPSSTKHVACVIKVIDRGGPGSRVCGRDDGFRIGKRAVIGRRWRGGSRG